MGGGGLLSTAEDYARFLRMMLRGGELDGARILAPATVEGMCRKRHGRSAGYAPAPALCPN